MTATRSRKEEVHYKTDLKRKASHDCPFCSITANDPQLIEEGSSFNVIQNIYAYSLWDGQGVTDHVMIVPKKHTDSLGTLKASDKVEYVDLLAKYEAKGYNVYARPPRSTSKSIAHQHTHLIQLDGKQRRFVLLLRKPYIRFISQK